MPPAHCDQTSPGQERHFLRHTCLWNRTWPHQADRSGSWRSPAWAAGSGWRSRLPLVRTPAKPLDSRSHCSAVPQCRYNPGQYKKFCYHTTDWYLTKTASKSKLMSTDRLCAVSWYFGQHETSFTMHFTSEIWHFWMKQILWKVGLDHWGIKL